MQATPHTEPRDPAEAGRIRKFCGDLASGLDNLRVADKVSGIAALLAVVMTLLAVMSIQAVRLQTEYRRALASSATTAINIERVNGLIYAIVMESRGIYMSTDPATVKRYADELLRRNRELGGVVAEWEQTVDFNDEGQFPAFKQRVVQFIDFRNELARRATRISPAAGREWGDNDANRALRSQLNVDLEAIARIYDARAALVADLADKTRMASWYLALLGLSGLLLTVLTVVVIRRSVIIALSDIAEATDSITARKIEIVIPHVARWDEIGHLARAVQNFRDAICRNLELEQLEIGSAMQRDTVTGQRDKLNDKYLETKWQLHAALDNMAQGLLMIDSKAKILMTNQRFRTMYQLPRDIVGPDCTLRDILTYRAEKGLFPGNIEEFMAAILSRIAKGKPSINELSLADGRVFRVSEQPMAGGGWVSTHEDFTEQRRAERILARTEQFLVTIIENIPEGIVAKDARNLRYVFVNRAAEKMIGMSRAEIIGKTARELFSAGAADLIERRDRHLLTQDQQLEAIVDTIDNPIRGRRTIAVRRLQVGGPDGESHLFVSMIEDRTDQANVANVAA
jgi:PAS domain S-box-containing protein